ncbi:bile acid:sodium symporter family protein [Isoalcanivorax indicus]|uniref:bile acid:sodium symporter family protein n=1 Tax=Isoalcanivorax indicus TaxID=2202653 RepID=UPI000DB99D7B|nr:bile acid:sodium symporter family protein [Isoalcanivorax indicus]
MEQGPLIEIGLPVSLFFIMIGMGLTLGLKDFREVAIAPKATLVGTLAQVLLMPLVALGVATAMALPPALAVGLVLIAACPGGTTSNVFAFLGRGDVALSIVLTVIASLVTILTLPLFVNWAMSVYYDETVTLRLPVLRTVITLFVIILVPVAIGMVVRRYQPGLAARAERIVGIFGLVVLVAVIIAILVSVGDEAWGFFRQAGAAAIVLNIAGIAIGLAGGRLMGLSREQAFTLAVEIGIKNGTLGLMIALSLMDSPEISIPSAVYGLLMFVFGFLLIGYSRLTGIGQVRSEAG